MGVLQTKFMYIAIDIGNSNITTGIFRAETCEFCKRIETHLEDLEIVYKNFLSKYLDSQNRAELKRIYISSVVPPVLSKILETLITYKDRIKVINSGCYAALPLTILRPNEIGTDLVCNAFAAYAKVQSNISIVDFGTALTITTVSDTGTILGVSITPGLKTALKVLNTQTAQLPIVPLSIPDSVLGKNTIHAIQSGVMLGYVGLVKYLIEQIKSELKAPLTVFGTGGLVASLPPLYDYFDYTDPLLTLRGVYLVGRACSRD